MKDKHRIAWLTILQGVMVVAGFGVFQAFEHLYHKHVIIPAFRRALVADLTKQKSLRANPLGFLLPWLPFPLVLVAARNAASIFHRAGRKKRQIKRDALAVSLLDQLRQRKTRPFSLYLRSFSGDDTLKRRKGIGWYLLVEGDVFGIDRETIDLMISSEVRRTCPMIAIGGPGAQLGAGRLPSTDREWWDLMVLLMQQAKVVFIVPGSSDGVVLEMEELHRHHHAKSIHIMPPSKYHHGGATGAERDWREARQRLAGRGIDLPEYDPAGALFMLDGKGTVTRRIAFEAPLGGSRVRELIREIL